MARSDLDRQTAASGPNWSAASVIAVAAIAIAIALIGAVLYSALREDPIDRPPDVERLERVHDALGDGWSCEVGPMARSPEGDWWYLCSTRNADEVRKWGGVPDEDYVAKCHVTLSHNGDVAQRTCWISVPYMGG